MSVYFAKADALYVYWSDSLEAPEQLAAVFSKGRFELVDERALEKFIIKYEADREAFRAEGKQIPSWNELVQSYQTHF